MDSMKNELGLGNCISRDMIKSSFIGFLIRQNIFQLCYTAKNDQVKQMKNLT